MRRRTVAVATLLAACAALLAAGCCPHLRNDPVPATAAEAAPAPADPGVRIVALPSPANPLVALRVVWQVGSVDDPPGREGLAALTAAMMARGGGGERTYAQVLDALYPMAADIGVYATRETIVIHGQVHRDNVDAYRALLLAQVLTPRFDPGDLERLRSKALDYVEKTLRSDDDEELGKHALHARMYAGHPYAHPVRGTAAGLRAITLDDVKAFHASHLSRDALVLGVAGGHPDGFTADLAAGLLPLAAERPPRAALPAPEDAAGHDVLIVDKPSIATAISMGHPLSVTRADADFYALMVAASYLGEHRTFNGVLMQNMRGKRGLNYGDYAYVESFLQEGWSTFPLPNIQRRQQHFEIWIRPVAPHNAGFALRQALYEVDKLLREGMSEAAFETTREFLLAYSRLWTQGGPRRLGYAIDGELVGAEVVAELQRRLPTLTAAEVTAAVRAHLRPADLTIGVATADGHALRETLLSGAKTPIVYDTAGTPPEILAEDTIIEAFPVALDPARVVVVPAAQMFAR